MKILIADDHALLRGGLKQLLLDELEDVEFGEATTTAETIERLHGGEWDVVFLDISMPGRGGLEVLEETRRRFPRLPVLVLSSAPEDQLAIRVLKAGAAGYLNKQAAPEELLVALQKVASGHRYVSAAIAERLAEEIAKPAPEAPHERLSTREFEVFEFMAKGRTIKEIAAILSISPKTVSTFRGRVFEKLGFHSDVELANYVHERGLFRAVGAS